MKSVLSQIIAAMSGLTRVEPEECFNFQEMGTDEVSLGIASHNVRALSSFSFRTILTISRIF
jgi:hypothetical protein